MKKITFLLFTVFCFWGANAQFTQNFDSAATLPTGWSIINGGGDNAWTIGTGTSINGGAHSGSNAARLVYNETAHDDYLITPSIAVTAGVNTRLSFWIKSRSATFLEPYEVRLSTTNNTVASSFSVVLQASQDAPIAWTKKEINLAAYVGQTVYVAIRATGTNEWELYADDFVSDSLPTCVQPTALTATSITSTSANLSWTAGTTETQWDVELVNITAGGTVTGTPTATGVANPYAATLVAGSNYQYYVRSRCSVTDQSSWSGPFLFTNVVLPGCPGSPVPANGATGVPAGPITLSWSVPTTGDAVVSYDLYSGDPGDMDLVGNYLTNTTGNDLVINAYSTLIYWKVIAKNAGGQSVGCAEWSFTTAPSPGYCLAAANGQWPTATYTPTTCNGTTSNVIGTNMYAGEFSKVNVTSGYNYVFTSGTNDFITIGSEDGTTAIAYGPSPLTWVATSSSVIRFYSNTSNQCGSESVNRTRSIVCSQNLSTEDFAGVNKLKAYPNPVKDFLNLSYSQDISEVAIFNLLGQQLFSKKINATESQINMSNLSKGTYLVKVTVDNEVKTIKIIKE